MKCFNHEESEAIGLCRACYKALCADCAADLGHSLACKSTHVQAVEDLNSLISTNIQASKQNGVGWWIGPTFASLFGLAIIFMRATSDKPGSPLTYVLGAALLAIGAIAFNRNRQLWGQR